MKFPKIDIKKITNKLKSTPKKVWLSLAMTFLIIIPAAVLLTKNKADAAWWNDSWAYRKNVSITNSNGSDLANQRVKITLNTATLISAGKMQSNCNDLRVTDFGGKILDHWDTDCNTASTSVYVKIANLPSSGSAVYVYYGNSIASNIEKSLGGIDNPGTSCKMMKSQGSVAADGVYYIVPGGNDADKIQVFCDITTLSEGWTVVLNSNRAVANPKPNWNDAINSVNVTGSFGNNLDAFDLILGLKYWNNIGNTALVQFGSNAATITKRATYTASSLNVGNDYSLVLGAETLYLGATTPGIKSYHSAGNYAFNTYDHGGTCPGNYGNSPWWYGACWSGSFWGGGDSGSYQDAPFWDGSVSDYNDHASIMFGGADSMKNVSTGAPSTEEKTVGPTAYWKFDEGQGSVANDSTSNGINGSISGATWKTEDQCVVGKCLGFNGTSSDYIFMTMPTLRNPQGMTISLWIKTSDASLNQTLASENGPFYVYLSGGKINVGVYRGNWVWAVGNTNLESNKWYNIVLTFDGSNMKSYINGNIETSTSAPGSMAGTTSMFLGYPLDPGNQYPFLGNMDEVKFYAYPRSTAQIAMDYSVGLSGMGTSAGAGTAFGGNSPKWMSEGLVGHWKMDEASWNGTAGEVKDASGAGNNGVAVGGLSTGIGKFGKGGYFDGVNDYVGATDSASTTIGTDFTQSAWIYPTADKSSASPQDLAMIFDRGGGATVYRIDGGLLVFNYWDATTIWLSANGGSAPLNKWTHVVATYHEYNATNATIKLYVNGVLVSSADKLILPIKNANIQIGSQLGNRNFIGEIDEARIYNRALSSQEVSQLYEYAPGPVGYWKLDENQGATGSVTSDSSGNGNNGTLFDLGLPDGPKWDSGKFGSALKFDGSQSVDTAADPAVLQTTTGTVCAWINPSDLSSGFSSFQGIFSYENDYISGNYGYAYGLREGGFAFLIGDNSGYYEEFGIDGIVENKWTHTCMTFSPTNVSLYKNSRSIGSWTPTKTAQFLPGNIARIGSYDNANNHNFRGKIDEVKVYNYIRTQKQIAEDMNGGNPANKEMLGYWKFDEGNGTVVNNSGTRGNAPSTITGATWLSSGKFGNALNFTNTNDKVDVEDPFIWGTGDFSMSAWVYRTGATVDSIVSNYGPTGCSDGVEFYFNGGQLSTYIGGYVTGATTVSINAWHYVATTRKDGVVNVYVDGKEDGSGILASNIGSNCTLTIGNGPNYTTENFNGSIDEVKVYNYALSGDEIKNDYNQGSSVKMSGSGTTTAGGNIDSKSAEYCVPGDSTSCSAPIGEWNFDEKQGTTIKDISGNGHDLSTFNNPTWSQGKFGASLEFDGTNKNAQRSDAAFDRTNGQGLSVSAWIYPKRNGGGQYQDLVVNRSGINPYPYNWILYQHGDGGEVSFHSGVSQHKSTYVPTLNTWTHIEAVVTTAGMMSLYANGKLVYGPVAYSYGSPAGTIGMGAHPDQIWTENYQGKIDQVRIYDYARTPAQVAYDYNRGGPVGWWKMDECQGNTIFDSSGNSNNGVLTSRGSGTQTSVGTCTSPGTVWGNGASGKFGSSVNFDGTDDDIGIPYSPIFDIKDAITLSAWYKKDVGSGTNKWLIHKATVNSSYAMFIEGGLKMRLLKPTTQDCTVSEPSEGVWHHAVSTYDGANMKIYVDGVLMNTCPGTGSITTTSYLVTIGAFNTGTGYPFSGQIDDVRIYNYALTPAQIANVMNEGGALRFGPAIGSAP
jgi:hypothetical protein